MTDDELKVALADAEMGLRTRLLNPADRECSPDVYVNPLAATIALHVRALAAEAGRLRKAILDFGSNPAGFDWGVLGRIDELETALDAERAKVAALRKACVAYCDHYAGYYGGDGVIGREATSWIDMFRAAAALEAAQ